MTARLGTNPSFQPRTTSGTLVTNGTITVSASGGSTAVKVYSESNEKSNLKNPLPLSIAANAPITWLKANDGTNGAFRYLIKDADGSTLYTYDDVNVVGTLNHLDQNLDVNSKSIVSSSNGAITIEPHSGNYIILDGHYWVREDGAANKVLGTDGSGTIIWTTNGLPLVQDLTPQLGGFLDCNSFSIEFDTGTGFYDDSHNQQLLFTSTTSAVNYTNITNSATGNPVILSAAGDDTNVGITFKTKGSGIFKICGIGQPLSDGGANSYLQTNGSGQLSFSTAYGDALQADMETATSFTTLVTPAQVKNHPGIAKAWCVFQYVSPAGTSSNAASYNVASITNYNAGTFKITYTTPFSSINYCVLMSAGDSSSYTGAMSSIYGKAVTTQNTTDVSWEYRDNAGTKWNDTVSTYTGKFHIIVLGDQ